MKTKLIILILSSLFLTGQALAQSNHPPIDFSDVYLDDLTIELIYPEYSTCGHAAADIFNPKLDACGSDDLCFCQVSQEQGDWLTGCDGRDPVDLRCEELFGTADEEESETDSDADDYYDDEYVDYSGY